MVDRLMPVGGKCSGRPPELPVEMDSRSEGKDAGGDAADEPLRRSGQVALELQLVFQRVDDRLDALADAPDRGRRTVWLVGALGPHEQGAELGDGLLEVGPCEALVGDHELARWRLPADQLEHGLPLSCVGGDELEVADAAIRAAPEHEPHAIFLR